MTALSQINAGGRITAAEVRGVAPLAVIKGADQSLASSTALANDNALFVAVAANASYLFDCFLDYEGGTQGSSDLKWQWAGPSGATLNYSYISYPTSGGVAAGNVNLAGISAFSNVRTAGTNGAGLKLPVLMRGTLVTGSTAGTFQLTWAQNTSSATSTIVHAGSSLSLWQVS